MKKNGLFFCFGLYRVVFEWFIECERYRIEIDFFNRDNFWLIYIEDIICWDEKNCITSIKMSVNLEKYFLISLFIKELRF